MKAVLIEKYGPPEALKIGEVPTPTPKQNEVLVRIKATAVNSGDVRSRALDVSGPLRLIMRLALGWKGPRAKILGTVYSGIVEAVGASVDDFEVGDEVFGCSPGMKFGTYAQYIAVPETSAIAMKPPHAPHLEAVSLLFGGATALYFFEKLNLHGPKRIIIYGASGAVGSAATQIAKIKGLEILAIASGKNEVLVRQLGATNFIDYNGIAIEDIAYRADALFDAVGKVNKHKLKKLLKKNGQMVSVAGLDVAKETKQHVQQLAEWYEQGIFVPVIDKVYQLDDIVSAHHYVDGGHKRGNVVISVE